MSRIAASRSLGRSALAVVFDMAANATASDTSAAWAMRRSHEAMFAGRSATVAASAMDFKTCARSCPF